MSGDLGWTEADSQDALAYQRDHGSDVLTEAVWERRKRDAKAARIAAIQVAIDAAICDGLPHYTVTRGNQGHDVDLVVIDETNLAADPIRAPRGIVLAVFTSLPFSGLALILTTPPLSGGTIAGAALTLTSLAGVARLITIARRTTA